MIFFKSIFVKMKRIPGTAWAWCETGVEEVGVTMALKIQTSLKYLYLRNFSLAGCTALKL